eukprot:95253-Amphidinium_carterae.1
MQSSRRVLPMPYLALLLLLDAKVVGSRSFRRNGWWQGLAISVSIVIGGVMLLATDENIKLVDQLVDNVFSCTKLTY